MKGFFANVSPRRAIVDLWQVLGAPSEFRFRSLALAMAVTGGIFYVMLQQGGRGLPRPPHVIYIESWRADRTDAEIIAGNIAAQQRADAEEAAQEAREDDVRRMYKVVGAATGLETQKKFDEGTRERAAAKAAEAARAKALLEQIRNGHP